MCWHDIKISEPQAQSESVPTSSLLRECSLSVQRKYTKSWNREGELRVVPLCYRDFIHQMQSSYSQNASEQNKRDEKYQSEKLSGKKTIWERSENAKKRHSRNSRTPVLWSPKDLKAEQDPKQMEALDSKETIPVPKL